MTTGERTIPEEVAVAFTYNGTSYAVMMATPRNLEDFAYGFSLTEGVIASVADIRHLDIVEHDVAWVPADFFPELSFRSRWMRSKPEFSY